MSIDFEERMSQIDRVLENEIVSRQSFFQIQHFVVNAQPTIQSKLWQCLRELKRKRDVVKHITLEKAEMQDNIELAEIETQRIQENEECFSLDKKEKEIKLRKARRKIEASKNALFELDRKLREEMEEALFYLRSFQVLSEKEELKPFDDPAVQREYWNEKLTQEVNLALLFRHPINMETIKTIIAMNDDAPIKRQLLNIIDQMQLAEEQKKLSNDCKKLEKSKETE